jgi:hypothetical protein
MRHAKPTTLLRLERHRQQGTRGTYRYTAHAGELAHATIKNQMHQTRPAIARRPQDIPTAILNA